MNPQLLSLIRSLLKIIGAFLAGRGAIQAASIVDTEAMAEMVGGAVMALVGLCTSWHASSPQSIQQKAADSLPEGMVLPATTDAAPKAVVVTPETATASIRQNSQTQNTTPSNQ